MSINEAVAGIDAGLINGHPHWVACTISQAVAGIDAGLINGHC